jgi:uncharacterized protein YcbX
MLGVTARIHGIYRYPVKGLSPEPLDGATLAVRDTLAADRLYAIENGPSGFDAAAPRHQPKLRFLMLMRNERLARLQTRYDDASGTPSSSRKAERPRAATFARARAARTSSASLPHIARASCEARPACCMPRASASPTFHPKWSQS